eukprot:XP_001699955.1 predicted protein [Chlamydomonas reinhardtii]
MSATVVFVVPHDRVPRKGAKRASAGSAAAAAAAAAGLPPTLVAVVTLLPSLGSFLLCVAGAVVLLLGCLPALWAMARAAVRAERLMAAAEAELPDTLAAMRLSGLELTDCIQELGALGGELTRGVRSTAALASMAEAGVRGGVAAADTAVRTQLLPAAAKAEGQARGEAACGWLGYTKPLVSQAISATTTAARRLRTGLAVGQLAGAAVQARAQFRSIRHLRNHSVCPSLERSVSRSALRSSSGSR